MKPNAFFGIETGGTKLQVVAGSETLQILERRRFEIERSRGAEGIREQIAEAIGELVRKFHPMSAGIGFGGPVDWKTGRVWGSHQIEGWSEFEFGGWLSKLLGVSVALDNDANIAALAEALEGAGVGRNPVFYVTLGSGVGGGLVVNGRIFHGAKPGESELGHVRLDRRGTIVEGRCSGWAVDRQVRMMAGKNPESILGRLVAESAGGEARHLGPALQQRDPVAEEILESVAGDLAFALSHVTHLCHPEIIVIGGGLSLIGEPLRASVATQLHGFVMDAFRPPPAIQLAALGEDVVPIGCLLAARQLVKT